MIISWVFVLTNNVSGNLHLHKNVAEKKKEAEQSIHTVCGFWILHPPPFQMKQTSQWYKYNKPLLAFPPVWTKKQDRQIPSLAVAETLAFKAPNQMKLFSKST